MLFFLFVILCVQVISKTCNIVDYGAKGDGHSDNTEAIQAAINDCSNGGHLIVPNGIYLSYPLAVTSAESFTFEIQKGGTLLAGDIQNWPVQAGSYVNFLQINSCKGCTLTGAGTIDGAGTPWYIAFDQGKLLYDRPILIDVNYSTKFTLTNLNILNAPKFNVYLGRVTGAEIAYVNIKDEWYMNGNKEMEPHNTDGIDPGNGSQDVHIHHCTIYNGDDSVAVKPGSMTTCTQNILVEDCQFSRGHGCSIGSVGKGCIQNVMFRNITMDRQMGGCVVKTYNQDIGKIHNITWQDITITNTTRCLYVNTNYHNSTATPQIQITNLNYIDITGSSCREPADFICQDKLPCTGIKLENVDIAKDAKVPTMTCTAAHGTAVNVKPASCLINP